MRSPYYEASWYSRRQDSRGPSVHECYEDEAFSRYTASYLRVLVDQVDCSMAEGGIARDRVPFDVFSCALADRLLTV